MATGGGDAVRIEGLKDFVKALKRVDERFPGELKDANVELAKRLVQLAKGEAGRVGGVAEKAARSLRSARQAAASVVVGGGARYPYFWGAEFGAKRYRQFRAWRGNQWRGWDGGPGYFLHPTIRRHSAELIEEYVRHLEKLLSEAFPE